MVLPKLGIAVGKSRGYPTTERKQKVVKRNKKKTKVVKRNTFIRDLCEEICGYAPYEGRVMELLGNVANTHSAEKRPVNFTKHRVSRKRMTRKLTHSFRLEVFQKQKLKLKKLKN